MDYDLGNLSIIELKTNMLDAARVATEKYIETYLDGEDRYACGFAWVTINPKHKGNTKAGRAERMLYTALGFKKDYTGKNYQIWNPSGSFFQNIDCKFAGARAAAEVLQGVGIIAYPDSRLD